MSGLAQLRPSVRGFLEDCALVVSDQRSVMDMQAEPEGMRRDTVRFVLYGADGSRVRPLASVLDAEQWLRNRDGSHGLVQPVFGEQLFAFVQGRELWTGTSDELRWLRRDLTGTELGVVVLEHEPRAATPADVEAERERLIEAVAELRVTLPPDQSGFLERGAELRRGGLQAVPARTHIPAYDRVVPGPRSGFWLRRQPFPSEADAVWLFIGSGGVRRGNLTMPREHELLAGSEHTVLVSAKDGLDVPLLYILRRPPDAATARRTGP